MADLESACFLNDLPEQPPVGCSRLYYGAEFCFWRLPSCENILAARSWARHVGWHFTLVTPVLGEDERLRLDILLQTLLPELEAGDEILISDWGALALIRAIRDDLTIILGRALSGQKRGPRILDMSLTPEQSAYFERGSWHNHDAVELLAEQMIERIEQDNLLQGLAPLAQTLKGSLHLPYAMVASSRNCPFRTSSECEPCPAPCGEVFTLRSSETDVLLYQDGNTQFLHNDRMPENFAKLGIDRIVKHPEFIRYCAHTELLDGR
ncbi:MAG: hypothetical protein KAU27_15045 [Desulfuromonadales bacterium]|nr:hypothetical protein [Desulfuromonadales bacterium]